MPERCQLEIEETTGFNFAQWYKFLGVRWQAQRDTALDSPSHTIHPYTTVLLGY
jgi:hypothetical protein